MDNKMPLGNCTQFITAIEEHTRKRISTNGTTPENDPGMIIAFLGFSLVALSKYYEKQSNHDD